MSALGSCRFWGIYVKRTRPVGDGVLDVPLGLLPNSPGFSCYLTGHCEIATGAERPRNDKLGGLMPQNPCGACCQPAWRSLSAATDVIGVYVSSTACTGRQCLPEIATSAAPPRNDKSGSLAPLNLCRLICDRPWRSMSAAANMVFRHAKGALRICSAPG